MLLKTLLAAATFAAFAGAAGAAEVPATDCDRLAASPNDLDRKAPGVDFDAIDGKAAEAACRAAIEDSVDTPRFMYQLGRALDREDRVDEAKAAYRAAFEAGYAPAYRAYGKLYELGIGGDVDYVQAGAFYQKALDAGMKVAAGDLAYLHEEGLGFDKDPAAAAPLYRTASEAGDAWAQVHLGYLYENGFGVEKNGVEAVKWYRAAADQGDALGRFDLGLMYELGIGVAKDQAEAVRLIGLASGQDNPLADAELAKFYAAGQGVAVDRKEAERLWRKAIENGEGNTVWQSQNEIAWMLAGSKERLEEAAALVAAALEKAPHENDTYPAALDTAAWIDHLRGKDEEALKRQLEAVSLQADFAPYHDRLGDIYAALGRKDEARAAWQKALDLPAPDANAEPGWQRDAVAKKLG